MRWVTAIIIALSTALSVLAQPPGGERRSQPDSGIGPSNHGGERPRFYRKEGPQQEGQYVDQWLEMLKKRNPEEFEKMRKLREENPEEFRQILHQRLQDMRLRGGELKDHPRVLDALKNLPPEDREWVLQRLQQPNFGGGPGRDRGGVSDFKHVSSPEIARGEETARALVKKYQEAPNDSARASAKEELRVSLSGLFDLREKTRSDQLRQIEEKFSKIRNHLNERMANREAIIDAHLEELLTGESKRP